MVLTLCAFGVVVCGYTLWMRRGALSKAQLWWGVVMELCFVGGTLLLLPHPVVVIKVLVQLLMPAGLFWLLLLGYTGYLWHRQRRKQATFCGLIACLYLVLGSGVLAGGLLDWIERDYLHVRPLTAKPFDAVFVLGGATRMNHHGMAYLTAAGDRVMLAARMYHQKRTPMLVAMGANLPGRKRESHAEETVQIWRSLQIPAHAITSLAGAYNTRMEVQALKKLTRQKGWQRVGLITSAWHMRRAMRLCQAAGVKVHPLPADFHSGSKQGWLRWNIPTGGGFAVTHMVLWEILGAFVGR